jgi:periplasmic divalent cation tolerance protein
MAAAAPKRRDCREPAQRRSRLDPQYNDRTNGVNSEVTDCCQVTTTLPDQSAAEYLAATLVAERLVACAQVLGPVSSTYRWKGKLVQAQEWYCYLKTTLRRLPDLQRRIRELHPYEVPEIIALPFSYGDEQYLEWVREEVKAP